MFGKHKERVLDIWTAGIGDFRVSDAVWLLIGLFSFHIFVKVFY